jgi:alanine-glyoxylate transaminase/serine-glyoxylate transaminase/serine-pyruvate transaminase
VQAWGLQVCAEHPSLCSDTVTAIRTPEGVDAREVIRIAYERFNCSLGSGLGPLNGKVFRIGHLGDLNEGMCLTAISIAEMALALAGADVRLGSGVAAAQGEYLRPANAVLRPATRPAARIAAE